MDRGLRLAAGRKAGPTAVVIDQWTLWSTPKSGECADHDGGKPQEELENLHDGRYAGSSARAPRHAGQYRERLARTVQVVTDDAIELAWVNQGYTGERAANAAARYGIALEVVKLPEAKRGFVLLPRRWVVERSIAWATRSGASPKTTNVMPRHSQDFTSSSSRAS